MSTWKYDFFGTIPSDEVGCKVLSTKRPVRWEPFDAESDLNVCRKIPMTEIAVMNSCKTGEVYDTAEKKCVAKGADSNATNEAVRSAVELEKKAVEAEGLTAAAKKAHDDVADDADNKAELKDEYDKLKVLSDAARIAANAAVPSDSESFVGCPMTMSSWGDNQPKMIALAVILVILFWKYKKQIRRFFK